MQKQMANFKRNGLQQNQRNLKYTVVSNTSNRVFSTYCLRICRSSSSSSSSSTSKAKLAFRVALLAKVFDFLYTGLNNHIVPVSTDCNPRVHNTLQIVSRKNITYEIINQLMTDLTRSTLIPHGIHTRNRPKRVTVQWRFQMLLG